MKTAHRNVSKAKRVYQKDFTIFKRVIGRATLYSESDLADKKEPIRASFAALKDGTANEVDFENLDIAFATTLERSREIDELCVVTVVVARDALERTWNRHQRTGRWGFDGPALIAVADAVDLHEQLLEQSTPHQMIAAARIAKRVVSMPVLTC